MRFPFSLTRSMAGYMLRNRLAGRKRFPLVLMLEPLHACNLKCAGCGRIREYAASLRQTLTVDECLASVDECGAPVVSICGGEPLIYPGIEDLTARILQRRKHIYLCTNGVSLAKKLHGFTPTSRLSFNIHLDGMENTHDRLAGRPGVFAEAVEGIRRAKRRGFLVCSNTTLYRDTDLHEIVVLFEYLSELGVDGFMISPAYGYEAVRIEEAGASLFMTREEIQARFREARTLLSRFRLTTTPLYFDFLCGRRDLQCAAWANPTRNVQGWKGPCYLVTDQHYASYEQLLAATNWDALGAGGDLRCQHCMVHCGYEPAAVFAARGLGDMLRMAFWQLG